MFKRIRGGRTLVKSTYDLSTNGPDSAPLQFWQIGDGVAIGGACGTRASDGTWRINLGDHEDPWFLKGHRYTTPEECVAAMMVLEAAGLPVSRDDLETARGGPGK